ncbi:MAG TPA: isoprenylcysteine carboxylmethyltransferase family protein, partial [Bacteroidales bacterium]|nr:isoprenylcysteine carboxylmethyltransferase family protein [Bacteroidales bacterium]
EFEKTTELVETGLYQYVRHPLYGSLIFLTWGVLLKHPTTQLIVVASVTTLFYFLTARKDELECIAYFGEKYSAYMKRSKMFIPFVV